MKNLPQKLKNINTRNNSIIVSINPLEGRMGLEFFKSCEFLSLNFDNLFSFLDEEQIFPEK